MSSKRINETELHELDVIDAIVRGGGEARPEDAALTDFALLVRNARPVPNHGEAAALDVRVQETLTKPKTRDRTLFKPAFAAFCALLLVSAVGGVAYLNQPDGDQATSLDVQSTSDSGGFAEPAPPTATGQEKSMSTATKAAAVPLPEQGVTSSREPRDVARDTRLTLAADGADIERLSDRVNAIVDKYGGYVAQSNVKGGEGNRGRATYDLMIPASQYKPALASLSKLAHARTRSQSSIDITTQANRAEREVKRWTTRVNRLEAQLAAADTTQQRILLRRQLASANAALRVATGDVRTNRARVNYVPIALTIVADKSAENKDKDKDAIAKAFDKAGTILTGIAAVLIIVLAVFIPVALIAAAMWFGIRRFNRSRSNRAIDAAVAPQSE